MAGFGQGSNRGLHVCYTDANSVVLAGNGNSVGNRVYLSRDKGATWDDISMGGWEITGAEFAGNDRNVIYQWGTSGMIAIYQNGTNYDRRGNIPTDYPAAGTIVRIAGL